MISPTRGLPAALLACAVSIASLAGYSAEPDSLRPEVRREAENIQKVLKENFRACNEENIRVLMATISPTMPGLAEFHSESLKMPRGPAARIPHWCGVPKV